MRANPFPGVFIAIEGIDGSGKSVQADALVAWVTEQYPAYAHGILKTHEPQDTGLGARIRRMLAGSEPLPEDPLAFQELYIRDRRDHLERVLIPHLARQRAVVVCDRYLLSTFAYGMAAGARFEDIMRLHEEILDDLFILPDATFVIAADASIALARVRVREGTMEYFEKKAGFVARVAQAYQAAAGKFPGTHSVPGNGTREETSNAIRPIFAALLEKNLL